MELRKLRERLGLTRPELGEIVEVSPITLYRIETGRHALPRSDTLLRLQKWAGGHGQQLSWPNHKRLTARRRRV